MKFLIKAVASTLFATMLCFLISSSAKCSPILNESNSSLLDYSMTTVIAEATAVDFYNQGVGKANRRDYAGAIKSYDKALEIDPNYVDAYIGKASTYYNWFYASTDRDRQNGDRAERFSKTLANYGKAIELDPDNALAYYSRAYVRKDWLPVLGVIEDLSQVIRIEPNNGNAYYDRAEANLKAENFEAALRDFQEAVGLNLDANKKSRASTLIPQLGYIDSYNKGV